MEFDAFFFDLDGCLYPKSNGLMREVNHRLDLWIMKVLPQTDPDHVSDIRHDLFTRYGGTLPGLTIEHNSPYYESLRWVHDIPVENYVSENPKLREVLMKLDVRKYIFTSSYRFYTVRVLRALGILECFDGIIDACDVFPKPKPAQEAFLRAFELTAEKDIHRCVFFDDQPRNIEAGHTAGFYTVQVDFTNPRSANADEYINLAEDLITIPAFRD